MARSISTPSPDPIGGTPEPSTRLQTPDSPPSHSNDDSPSIPTSPQARTPSPVSTPPPPPRSPSIFAHTPPIASKLRLFPVHSHTHPYGHAHLHTGSKDWRGSGVVMRYGKRMRLLRMRSGSVSGNVGGGGGGGKGFGVGRGGGKYIPRSIRGRGKGKGSDDSEPGSGSGSVSDLGRIGSVLGANSTLRSIQPRSTLGYGNKSASNSNSNSYSSDGPTLEYARRFSPSHQLKNKTNEPGTQAQGRSQVRGMLNKNKEKEKVETVGLRDRGVGGLAVWRRSVGAMADEGNMRLDLDLDVGFGSGEDVLDLGRGDGAGKDIFDQDEDEYDDSDEEDLPDILGNINQAGKKKPTLVAAKHLQAKTNKPDLNTKNHGCQATRLLPRPALKNLMAKQYSSNGYQDQPDADDDGFSIIREDTLAIVPAPAPRGKPMSLLNGRPRPGPKQRNATAAFDAATATTPAAAAATAQKKKLDTKAKKGGSFTPYVDDIAAAAPVTGLNVGLINNPAAVNNKKNKNEGNVNARRPLAHKGGNKIKPASAHIQQEGKQDDQDEDEDEDGSYVEVAKPKPKSKPKVKAGKGGRVVGEARQQVKEKGKGLGAGTGGRIKGDETVMCEDEKQKWQARVKEMKEIDDHALEEEYVAIGGDRSYYNK